MFLQCAAMGQLNALHTVTCVLMLVNSTQRYNWLVWLHAVLLHHVSDQLNAACFTNAPPWVS